MFFLLLYQKKKNRHQQYTFVPSNKNNMSEEKTLASQIGEKLTSTGKTMATAESCTGGNIAHLITLTPGSSSWFAGGIVSYTNHVKIKLLNVPSALIAKYTEVSGPVAESMAIGARQATGADFAVSTTGIAGPDGGSAENPVGTVYIGISTPSQTMHERFECGTDRAKNIEAFSNEALRLLLDNIQNTH